MFNEQLKAWAIDRAIETFKSGGGKIDPSDVIATALAYAEFTQCLQEDTEGEHGTN